MHNTYSYPDSAHEGLMIAASQLILPASILRSKSLARIDSGVKADPQPQLVNEAKCSV